MGFRSPEKRRKRLGYLVDRLLQGEEVSLEELTKVGGPVDPRTARNDMTALHQLRTKRQRGKISPAFGSTFEGQRTADLGAKLDVAVRACALFQSVTSIAAGAGTTVALTVAELPVQGIAVSLVSNSLALAEYSPTQLELVGGEYFGDLHAVVGNTAVEAFRRSKPREGLIGVGGIDALENDATLFVRTHAEVEVLAAMLSAVRERIVIVASVQKLGRPELWQFATLRGLNVDNREIVLVTNRPDDWRKELGTHYSKAKWAYDRLKRLEQRSVFSVVEAPRRGLNSHHEG